MTQAITGTQVIDALSSMAGMPFNSNSLRYIHAPPHRGRVLAAIRADDAEGLSAYAAQAVTSALFNSGFDGVVTPKGLRTILASDGWGLMDDVMDKRENAADVLKRKLAVAQGDSQFAGQVPARRAPAEQDVPSKTQEATQASPPRASEHDRDRRPPAASDRPQAGGQQRSDPRVGAPAPRESQPRQARSDHPNHPNHPSQPQTGAPRRHDQSNVRSIGTAPSRPANDPGNTVEREFDQTKVHGGKSALNFESDRTRRRDQPTVRLEAARMLNPQERTYDWKNKIVVQLTTSELQHVTALLYGLIPDLKFTSHGPAQDKWFSLERQTGSYAGTVKIVVGQGKDNMCIVQLTSADYGDLIGLFIRQCSAQMKVEQAALPGALRPVAEAYNSARAARSGGAGQQRRTG